MGQLILIRHGQSTWNAQNRLTGRVDVPLSPQGRQEAMQAAALLGISLRSIIMQLDQLDEQDVAGLELSTGVPIIYEFSNGEATNKHVLAGA